MLDLIIKLNAEFQVKSIQQLCEFSVQTDFTGFIGQDIEHMLGASLEQYGIIELNNNFYRYQYNSQTKELYLSREGILLELYRQTLENMTEGIQIYDRNGYFLYANPASEALEGYESREYQGKHLLDIYDINEEYSTVLTILRTKRPVANRCDRFTMKKGTTLTTINSGYPLVIDGRLCGAAVYESDLSVLTRLKKRTFNLEAYIGNTESATQTTLYTFDNIVHEDESMKEIIHFAKKVSLTDSAILIVGATGTGKELVAQSIHSFSPRRYKAFVDVNCSAVPDNLFESIFFGTEKGAFTGSVSKPGLFEMANGGTLFLDEVNSISNEMQAKLLRVLQEKRFQRIGGSKYIQCDVRIISAANEDLSALIQQKKIRMDFFYRISAIKIDLPCLKDRNKDIELLTRSFIGELCKQYNRVQLSITDEVLAVFKDYEWPGNIRELYHVIEYAFNRAADDAAILTTDHLPEYIRTLAAATYSAKQDGLKLPATEVAGTFNECMHRLEYELIRQTLTSHAGNITRTARQLGMSRQSLQYRMKKLCIPES